MASSFTINTRLIAYGVLSFAFVAVVSLSGYLVASLFPEEVGNLAVTTSALRNTMIGDMMHDALR